MSNAKSLWNREQSTKTLANLFENSTNAYARRKAFCYLDGSQSYTYAEFKHKCLELSHMLSRYGISEITIDPAELLTDPALHTGSLAGGDKTENARILLDILSGRDHTAKRGAVLLNAAAICCAAGLGESVKACIPLAAKSIDSGAAMEKLERLKA